MIKKLNLQLVQNTIQFQSYDKNINTCGKYVTFVCNSIIHGLNLQEIQQLLLKIHTEKKESYDTIVNHFFRIIFKS